MGEKVEKELFIKENREVLIFENMPGLSLTMLSNFASQLEPLQFGN